MLHIVDFSEIPVKICSGDFMDCNLSELGSRIAARRKHMKISQHLLAEKVGISNNHMSNIERGREKPSFDVLVNLCNELKVTPDFLLMGSMHPSNIPQNVIDSLELCSEEDIKLLEIIVHHMVLRRECKWNRDNF